MKSKNAQASFEYLIIMGFVMFILISILGIALIYSSGVKDRIAVNYMNICSEKIISTAESVFYSGEPSLATVSCYLPSGIKEILITEDSLIVSLQTSSGITRTSFSSKVPITGEIPIFEGFKRIKLEAGASSVVIGVS